VSVEVGIDENNNLLKHKSDLWLSYTLKWRPSSIPTVGNPK